MASKGVPLFAALLITWTGMAWGAGVNFSSLTVGTVTDLRLSQTGAGRGRISNGNTLTFSRVTALSPSSAQGTTASEGDDADTAFIHSGHLTTLSLTQSNASAATLSGNNENAISGEIHTHGGRITVTQNGNSNTLDLSIGSTGTPLITPTIAITQTGDGNLVGLTRSAGINSDTLRIYGDTNVVSVNGSGSGVNSASILLGSAAAAANSNQVWLSQTGSANALTATVAGHSNLLDVSQSGAGASGTITLTGGENALNLTQAGANAFAIIAITGNSNTATVNQTVAAIGAVAHLNVTGDRASLSVTQQTSGAHFAGISTIPSGGSLTVIQ